MFPNISQGIHHQQETITGEDGLARHHTKILVATSKSEQQTRVNSYKSTLDSPHAQPDEPQVQKRVYIAYVHVDGGCEPGGWRIQGFHIRTCCILGKVKEQQQIFESQDSENVSFRLSKMPKRQWHRLRDHNCREGCAFLGAV